ncbi:MAG: M1 family aminopeptidase [Sandaracinaceae bacterium]
MTNTPADRRDRLAVDRTVLGLWRYVHVRTHLGRGLALVALGLGAALAPSAQEAPHGLRVAPAARSAASEAWDATFYDLRLDLDPGAQRVDGTVRALGRATESLTKLRLDLHTEMVVAAVQDALTGAPLSFVHDADVLTVNLGATRDSGALVGVDIEYAGTPRADGFGAFVFSQTGGRPAVWSLSEPYGARAWWPSKDHPSDKADSVRVAITAPSGLRVGSNGQLVSETTEGDRTATVWASRYPITTYLVSLAVGPYGSLQQTYARPDSLAARYGPLDLPVLHYWYAPTGGEPFPQGWAEVLDILPVLESWFGPYPFGAEKYGHAEFGWGGGMEHQTMSSMGGDSPLLVAHEVAHQWFGDAVTTETWPHLWLNEGFASYAELLYWQARPDRYPGRFRQALAQDQASARSAQGTLVVADTASVGALFASNRVYAKGSAVVHMLRTVLGDGVFRDVLQAYQADFAYGTASTGDLRETAERVSGRDLTDFFRQWATDGTGYPVYEIAWSATPASNGVDVAVTVRQTQTAPLSNVDAFVMPVTLEVATASGTERFVVANDRREQTFVLRTSGAPTAVRLDPDGDLLRAAEVAVGAEAPPRPQARVEVYPNPARDALSVDGVGGGTGPVQVVVVDVRGRVVLRAEADPPGPLQLDLSGLAAGAYTLSVDVDGVRSSHSFTRVR